MDTLVSFCPGKDKDAVWARWFPFAKAETRMLVGHAGFHLPRQYQDASWTCWLPFAKAKTRMLVGHAGFLLPRQRQRCCLGTLVSVCQGRNKDASWTRWFPFANAKTRMLVGHAGFHLPRQQQGIDFLQRSAVLLIDICLRMDSLTELVLVLY